MDNGVLAVEMAKLHHLHTSNKTGSNQWWPCNLNFVGRKFESFASVKLFSDHTLTSLYHRVIVQLCPRFNVHEQTKITVSKTQ